MNKTVKAFLSAVLSLVMLLSICVLPAMAYEVTGNNGLYVYIGDSMTFDFVGSHNQYLESTDIYAWQAARAMGYSTDDYGKFPGGRATDVYAAISDYPGDDYSLKTLDSYVSGKRAERFTQAITEAEAISIQIGYSELTTFLAEDLISYFNTGALEFDCDLSQVFTPDELAKNAPIISMCMEFADNMIPDDIRAFFSQFLALLSDVEKQALIAAIGQKAYDVLSGIADASDTIKEVFTYVMVSTLVHFDSLVAQIYALNPDVDLYVMGLMNPITPYRIGFNLNGLDLSISAGSLLDGFFNTVNRYYRVLSPYADRYYFVENVAHAEVYGEAMAKDEELTTQILYACYNGNSRAGYGTSGQNAAAYRKAKQQAPGVMQMLNNLRTLDLGKIIDGISAGTVTLDQSLEHFGKLAHYDENGNTTASYAEQLSAFVTLFSSLKGIAVHPTPAGHNAEASLLIAAMQKKRVDPLAVIYHRVFTPFSFR